MGMRYRDLTGRQGDWLVKVTWEDGSIELVPTAHNKFYDGATGTYRRTDNSMERFKGKLSSWKDRICETHKVVLTDDDWHADAPLRIGHTPPKRSGYVGVFDISELECEGTGAVHSFKVVKRYEKTGRQCALTPLSPRTVTRWRGELRVRSDLDAGSIKLDAWALGFVTER
jgi:hypothetical protein